jgi:hypothetical protein
VIASVLFAAGWLACKACSAAWLAAAFCGSALAEGWQSARDANRPRPRPA